MSTPWPETCERAAGQSAAGEPVLVPGLISSQWRPSLSEAMLSSTPDWKKAFEMCEELRIRIMALQIVMVLIFAFCASVLY